MSNFSGRIQPERGDPHGWNSLNNYLTIHETQLDRLRSYFVIQDTLAYVWLDAHTLRIEGRITCQFGIFLDVRKTLDVNERGQVRTIRYRYHAAFDAPVPRPIFRYDNAHRHPGHDDEHHKHHVNYATWTEISPPEWIGYERWPTLAEVLDEVYDWWHETGRFLDLS